jgi:putative hydrolase of the HAD superfamily
MIKALMIDVDGVIVNGRPADGRHWGAELETDLRLSFAVFQDSFFKPHWEQIVTGRAGLRDRLESVLAEIAPGITQEELLKYWFQHDARLNDRFLQDLAVLRSDGLRAYLATNQEHERARYLMHDLGLASHVDGCHYSAAVGHRKPHDQFFRTIARKVSLPPDELLLIDDSEENVRAAVAAGWLAAHWTPSQTLSSIMGQLSATTV